MKTAVLLLFSLLLPFHSVFADHGLTPVGFVNDYASLLSAQSKEALEQDLQNFEKQTGNEIAVAIIASLEGNSIEDFATRLFEEWKIGKKGEDNGLLLLIAIKERQVRIEVGYGLEPLISDGRAGRIIRDQMTPSFKEGDYDKGIKEAINTIKQYIIIDKPEAPQEAVRDALGRALPGIFDNQFFFFFLILVIIYAADFMARSKSIWFGGLFGGVLGLSLGWLFISVALGAFLVLALGTFGLLLDYFLSRNYQERKRKGLPVDFWSSRGGFGGGGFRGGGGFGGFGGGMSGGGGASGRW